MVQVNDSFSLHVVRISDWLCCPSVNFGPLIQNKLTSICQLFIMILVDTWEYGDSAGNTAKESNS